MKLPNGAAAVVDVRKLMDYCLSDEHPRGRHKAKVFRAALDMGGEDAERLRRLLLEAAEESQAEPGRKDRFGRRYVINSIVQGPNGPKTVRSLWLIRTDEDFPRLLTCYVT